MNVTSCGHRRVLAALALSTVAATPAVAGEKLKSRVDGEATEVVLVYQGWLDDCTLHLFQVHIVQQAFEATAEDVTGGSRAKLKMSSLSGVSDYYNVCDGSSHFASYLTGGYVEDSKFSPMRADDEGLPGTGPASLMRSQCGDVRELGAVLWYERDGAETTVVGGLEDGWELDPYVDEEAEPLSRLSECAQAVEYANGGGEASLHGSIPLATIDWNGRVGGYSYAGIEAELVFDLDVVPTGEAQVTREMARPKRGIIWEDGEIVLKMPLDQDPAYVVHYDATVSSYPVAVEGSIWSNGVDILAPLELVTAIYAEVDLNQRTTELP